MKKKNLKKKLVLKRRTISNLNRNEMIKIVGAINDTAEWGEPTTVKHDPVIWETYK